MKDDSVRARDSRWGTLSQCFPSFSYIKSLGQRVVHRFKDLLPPIEFQIQWVWVGPESFALLKSCQVILLQFIHRPQGKWKTIHLASYAPVKFICQGPTHMPPSFCPLNLTWFHLIGGAWFLSKAPTARASGKCSFKLLSLAVEEGTWKSERFQVPLKHNLHNSHAAVSWWHSTDSGHWCEHKSAGGWLELIAAIDFWGFLTLFSLGESRFRLEKSDKGC